MPVHLNFIEEITEEEEALNCSDSTAQMVETINSRKAALQEYQNFAARSKHKAGIVKEK